MGISAWADHRLEGTIRTAPMLGTASSGSDKSAPMVLKSSQEDLDVVLNRGGGLDHDRACFRRSLSISRPAKKKQVEPLIVERVRMIIAMWSMGDNRGRVGECCRGKWVMPWS
jgi:hypothetical protein